jgi:DNA (cytosine-5)-methyltransferase 1
MLHHGSLFSGVGGFDLAATWVGWQNMFNCERDRFCRRILNHYWPQTPSYEDIKQFSAIKFRGIVDVLSGGFPCQPFSQAGKRLGTSDDRYLWPEMLRIIDELEPSWVVGENVFGLVNWEGGMVFRKVLTNLEDKKYEVWPYVLPAAGVGAPHQRKRIFFVACKSGRFSGLQAPSAKELFGSAQQRIASDSDSFQRRQRGMYPPGPKTSKRHAGARDSRDGGNPWHDLASQSPLSGPNDGLPRELDGITFSSWRKHSISAYGNAVVPQVAFQIFDAINELEQQLKRA